MSGVEISLDLGRPLTLADLRQFVERCGEFGIDDSSELKARVTMGGKVKKLTARERSTASPPTRGAQVIVATPGVPAAARGPVPTEFGGG